MELIKANGIEIACEITGEGPPIILCHGGEADHGNFFNFAPILARDFTVIAFDQRDTGGTVNPPDAYTLADMGKDLGALIRALGYQKAHVFGTSFGGVVAQHAAIQCPDAIDHLVLSVSFAGGRIAVSDEVLAFARNPNKSEDDLRTYRRMFFSRAFIAAHPEQVDILMSNVLTKRTPEQTARRGAAGLVHDARAQLPTITIPTLVLSAADDQIVSPAFSEELARLIPRAELLSIPDLGHATTVEAPDRVAEALRRFCLGT